jgi:hypothetical protein
LAFLDERKYSVGTVGALAAQGTTSGSAAEREGHSKVFAPCVAKFYHLIVNNSAAWDAD